MARFPVSLMLLLTIAGAVHAETDEEAVPEPYAPRPDGDYHFFEGFEGEDAFDGGRIIKSGDEKYAGQPVAIVADDNGIEGDNVVILQESAKHYGVVLPFGKPFNSGGDFVLQYEVRLNNGLECGGAYLKVLAEDTFPEPSAFNNETPYIVMFGPDKCGETNKVHFILRHQNPVSKEWEEKHLKSPPAIKTDSHSHLYTLIIRKDNTFQIRIDNEQVKEGSLLEEMEPPINPPEQIDDPEDSKPEDWVDEAQIADPEAAKPDDWDEDAPREIEDAEAEMPEGWLEDEPEYVDDPEAEMPDDWDEEEDGAYEAPQVENPKCVEAPGCGEWVRPVIANPEYKGKWSAPMIDNPEYKGEWAPAKIDNPNYFVDETPSDIPSVAGVAVEVWTMSKGVSFDNVLLTTDHIVADAFAEETFEKKIEVQAHSAKDKAKKERAAKRAKLLEAGDFSSMAQYYFGEAMEVAGDYPILAAVGLIGTTFGLLFLVRSICGGSQPAPVLAPRAAPAKQPKKAAASEEDEDEEEEEEESEEPSEEEESEEAKDKGESKKSSLRQRKGKGRKKAPRID